MRASAMQGDAASASGDVGSLRRAVKSGATGAGSLAESKGLGQGTRTPSGTGEGRVACGGGSRWPEGDEQGARDENRRRRRERKELAELSADIEEMRRLTRALNFFLSNAPLEDCEEGARDENGRKSRKRKHAVEGNFHQHQQLKGPGMVGELRLAKDASPAPAAAATAAQGGSLGVDATMVSPIKCGSNASLDPIPGRKSQKGQ